MFILKDSKWVDIGNERPYDYIRRTHSFLTDTNHDYKDTGDSIVIYRNENSPELHPITPVWARYDNFWFGVQYKYEDNRAKG